MSARCRKNRAEFQEFTQGTLGEAESVRLERHLEICEGCAAEFRALRLVQDLGLSLAPGIDSVLPRFHRQVLAGTVEAGGAAQAFERHGFQLPAWAERVAATVAVAVALLVPFLFGVVEIGVRGPGESPNSAITSNFSITFEQNRLVITWPENGHRTHRIARSTSPEDFSNAEIRVIKGNRWVDDEPQPVGTVYFYRVD